MIAITTANSSIGRSTGSVTRRKRVSPWRRPPSPRRAAPRGRSAGSRGSRASRSRGRARPPRPRSAAARTSVAEDVDPRDAEVREDQVEEAEVVVRDELPDEADEHGGREQRHVQRQLEDVAALAIAVEEQREEQREDEDDEDRLDDVDRRVPDRVGQLRVGGDLPPVLEADPLGGVEQPALVEGEVDRPADGDDEEREEGDEVRKQEEVGDAAAPPPVGRGPAGTARGSASADPIAPLSLPPTSSFARVPSSRTVSSSGSRFRLPAPWPAQP